jgi:hypothetical protein
MTNSCALIFGQRNVATADITDMTIIQYRDNNDQKVCEKLQLFRDHGKPLGGLIIGSAK